MSSTSRSARIAPATWIRDRIVDDLVFWGDLDTIVEKLQAHVEAGADHVAVQVIGIQPGRSAMPYWRMLGDALLSRGVSAEP